MTNTEQMWWVDCFFWIGSLQSNQINYIIKFGNLTCWKIEFHVDLNIWSEIDYSLCVVVVRFAQVRTPTMMLFVFRSFQFPSRNSFSPVRFFFISTFLYLRETFCSLPLQNCLWEFGSFGFLIRLFVYNVQSIRLKLYFRNGKQREGEI